MALVVHFAAAGCAPSPSRLPAVGEDPIGEGPDDEIVSARSPSVVPDAGGDEPEGDADRPPDEEAPALPAKFSLQQGWYIEPETGLPVDSWGIYHSVGYEFSPPILREAPSCFQYGASDAGESVLVRFSRGTIVVKNGGCTDVALFYRATPSRPFEVKSSVAGGTHCERAQSEVDAEHVLDAFDAARDIRRRGNDVVLLGERGKVIAVFLPDAEDCSGE